MRSILALSITFFSVVFGASAQNIQSPEEYLGYELGTRFTRHHKVVEYFRYVASQLQNVQVEKYGETYENRELITAVLTSPENFNNLEEIRTNNVKLSGLMEGTPTANKKAIVWLSYNVHGNESVSMEASMKTLYELVNPSNKKSKEWLENTVVIIDPCINPDGRDRYANFYNQYGNRVPNPDLYSKEHREPWPGGRANHYLFDLNRDWAWVKQKESAQRLEKYHEWMPHVHVDFHEQGVNSPYYFAPAAEPYHEVITDWQREFQVLIGKNNAKYFDENNWLYFTKETFDLLYPSYGDTYPIYNGAIGMTFEQGGSGRAGLTVTTEFGDELTLKDRIAHHHSNGLSTVEVASTNAEKMITEFERFFDTATDRAEYKSYLIKSSNNPDKLDKLTQLLDKHRISYGTPASTRRPVSGFSYQQGRTVSVSMNTGDLLIPVDQPKGTLITTLFEPNTAYSDSLTYDITAWALPYAHGLDAYAIEGEIAFNEEFELPMVIGQDQTEGAYAYLFTYTSFQDAKLLAYLQSQGVHVRSAEREITIEGKTFGKGALVITQRNNEHLGDDLESIIKEGAKKLDRWVTSVSTGFADSGYDLGSGKINYIPAPKVALLGGPGTSSLAFGETWYYLEQELEYQVSVLDTDYFNGVNLDTYDVLIVPNGYYSIFNESVLQKLNGWVRNGGRLILVGNALRSFAGKEGFGLSYYEDDADKKEAEKREESYENPLRKYENRDREGISREIIGAIYKVNLDNSHPLAFGYNSVYHSLKTSAARYAWLKNGWNVGYLSSGAKAVSGFVGYQAEPEMGKSLVFGVEQLGGGDVIYMVDNPLFRAFWEDGKLLFANAIFMVGQ